MWRWVVVAVACSAACRFRFDERSASDGDTVNGDGCDSIPGLVAYFPMEAADLSGSVLRDRSGNQHDGVVTGDSVVKPSISSNGHIGTSFDLTATTAGNLEYVDITGVPLPTAMGEGITISLWFYRSSSRIADDVLFDAPPPPPSIVRYDVWLSNNRACFNSAANDCWGVANTTLVDRWVHLVAIMRNGATINSELYLDGVPQVMTCLNGTMYPCDKIRTLAPPVLLGGGDISYTYRGLLDEVRLYDHALTPEQIAALAQDTTCL